MQAIITHTIRKDSQIKVVATTASGKTRSQRFYHQPNEEDHRGIATVLSRAMGWGKNLVGGETKTGFAYVPVQGPLAPSFESVERAARTLMNAAAAFPSYAPTTLADGILSLSKSA